MRRDAYTYLASPYSATAYDLCGTAVDEHDTLAKQIREQRYRLSLIAAARLNRQGIVTFSPIVHTHEMAALVGEQRHEFWMAMDIPLLIPAASLIVLMIDGWDRSRGVHEEWEVARDMDKPIFGLPASALETDAPMVLLPDWAVNKGMEK